MIVFGFVGEVLGQFVDSDELVVVSDGDQVSLLWIEVDLLGWSKLHGDWKVFMLYGFYAFLFWLRQVVDVEATSVGASGEDWRSERWPLDAIDVFTKARLKGSQRCRLLRVIQSNLAVWGARQEKTIVEWWSRYSWHNSIMLVIILTHFIRKWPIKMLNRHLGRDDIRDIYVSRIGLFVYHVIINQIHYLLWIPLVIAIVHKENGLVTPGDVFSRLQEMPDVLLLRQLDGAFLHETVVEAYQVLVIGQGAVAREAFESCGTM